MNGLSKLNTWHDRLTSRMRGAAAVMICAVMLAGCAVVETTEPVDAGAGFQPGTITIEHATNQFLFAQLRAEEYCDSLGADTGHLRTEPIETNVLFLRTNVSVFVCLNRSPSSATK